MNKILYNKNFFEFTGGPGVGKTTVLNELARRNLRCVQESARKVIQEQADLNVNTKDPEWRRSLGFAELSLKSAVGSYISGISETGIITFFDRGIPDSFSHPGIDISAADKYRYNNSVFTFPPWEEIYQTDEQRIQSYEESVEVYGKVVKGYKKFGYELIEVPKISVQERANFIISNAENLIK